jgi:hypothetical protein
MKLALIIAASLALVGCGHTSEPLPDPVVRTVEVKVPVAVSCVPKGMPARPADLETRHSLAAAATAEERYQRLAADWLRRFARMEVTEPIIAECAKAPP